jgi:hypothetical protein
MDDQPVSQRARKPIPKRIRFKVFKRDGFKCQYCGASAPDVLLQVDHIKPAAAGGEDDIINLITACAACNAGKRDKPLDDKTSVAKARQQLEELQERREQLEMMMAWQEGLRSIRGEAVDRLCAYWQDLAPGWVINDNGKKKLRQWLRKFSLDELIQAMNVAADQYLKFDQKNAVTNESWEEAFNKIPGICRVERASKDDPDIRDLYYIRGIARNRSGYFDNAKALEWLKAARSWGVPIEELRQIACNATSWTKFINAVNAAIENQERIQETH